jgi:hypothetical protein
MNFFETKKNLSKLKRVADFPLSFKTLLEQFFSLLNGAHSGTIRSKTPARPGAAQNTSRRPE